MLTYIMYNILILWLLLCTTAHGDEKSYLPNWDSLDSRPLPSWYDEAKIGIFIHWGVFSVPSYGSEWFWHHWKSSLIPKYKLFMINNYKPGFSYQDFAKDFTAEFFDPFQWANIFKNSGAKYVVLTSKHHEGYTLWPSKFSFSWNSEDVGPHRDLVGELAVAIRRNTNLKFGLYHSLYEWYHPLWLQDKNNNFTTNHFVHGKILPEMKELVTRYRPEILWSDGEHEASDCYWGSTKFLAWLYNSSPVKDTVVTNDRWGTDTTCKHGGFYTCHDRYNPGVLQAHKWENAMTIDRQSWGYRREAVLQDFLTDQQLIREIVSTISCGGNILINIGPTREGMISPIFEERLRTLGKWLRINGEAVYASKPWTFQNETIQTGVWYTQRKDNVYAFVLDWPKSNLLTLHRPKIGTKNKVQIVGYKGEIKWQTAGIGVNVILPDISIVNQPLPWVLRFTNVTN